jgi:hypothetical protein
VTNCIRRAFAKRVQRRDRSDTENGGRLRYRVTNTASAWKTGETPKLAVRIDEGDASLST